MSGWDGIEEFLAVYDRASFSAAAKALKVSPSHVSRAIVSLERRLRAQLFFRTTRKVTATSAAHAFAETCRKMVGDRDRAFSTHGEQQIPQGELRLTCPVGMGERYIAPLLRRFIEHYPGLRVVLDLDDHHVDIVARGYDMAIRIGAQADSNLIATRVSTRHLRLCASPKYIARRGAPESMQALAEHECLSGEGDSWWFSVDGRVREFRPKGAWQCNGASVLADAAVAGLGICQLSDVYLRHYIDGRMLVSLLEDQRPPGEPIWVVRPRGQQQLPKVRLFVSMLRDEFATLYKRYITNDPILMDALR